MAVLVAGPRPDPPHSSSFITGCFVPNLGFDKVIFALRNNLVNTCVFNILKTFNRHIAEINNMPTLIRLLLDLLFI